MSLTAGQPKKPVPPRCVECGATKPMAVLRDGVDPDMLGGISSHMWLCGDCVYRRDHPDAAPAVPEPRSRRPLKLQTETLF
jgi:hypothetical protein